MSLALSLCLAGILSSAAPLDPEAEAIKALLKLGATITRDDKLPGKPVVEVAVSLCYIPGELGDDVCKHALAFTRLRTLRLKCAGITPERLAELASLKELQVLDLILTPLPNECFTIIAKFENLREIFVGGPLFQNEDLKELAALKGLQKLHLGFTLVTDAGLKELRSLDELTELEFWMERITDEGLKHLAGLKKLRRLKLTATKITDEGMKSISAMTNLEELILDRTEIISDGVKELAPLKKLRLLDLRHTQVTNSSVSSWSNSRTYENSTCRLLGSATQI